MSMLTEQENLGVCQYTSGAWLDEPAAMKCFDELINSTGLFHIYREVSGDRNQPRLDSGEKEKLKIDRVLVPSRKLLDLNWTLGSIGVEGKQPETPLGPVVCQCLDYGRTVWHLVRNELNPMASGQWVMCPWTFIWHLKDFAGDIASVMAQHRIGGVYTSNYYMLNFKHAGGSILSVEKTGAVKFVSPRCGMKAGSR